MNRTRLSIGVLAAASAVLLFRGVSLLSGEAYDPSGEVALMEESRGFALGRRIARDLPKGGLVVFLDTPPATDALRATAVNLRTGLQNGAGGNFRVQRYETALQRQEGLPDFLQDRTTGNAHLSGLPDALAAHPGAVAVATRTDPAADLPPAVAAAGVPPLYILGSGEEAEWTKLLRGGPVRAVQIDRMEGYSEGAPPRDVEAAAERYYRVIPAP